METTSYGHSEASLQLKIDWEERSNSVDCVKVLNVFIMFQVTVRALTFMKKVKHVKCTHSRTEMKTDIVCPLVSITPPP